MSKRLSASYRSGPSRDWLKIKNPASPAMIRAREAEQGEDYHRQPSDVRNAAIDPIPPRLIGLGLHGAIPSPAWAPRQELPTERKNLAPGAPGCNPAENRNQKATPTITADLIGAETNTRSPPRRTTCRVLFRRSRRGGSAVDK